MASADPFPDHKSPIASGRHKRTPSSSNKHTNPFHVAAAAFLATATILSSVVPADAANTGFGLPGTVDASAKTFQRHGVPTTLVLAAGDDDAGIVGSGAVGGGGRVTDVADLVKELKGGRDEKELLGTMIKINEIVDADEEGIVENSFAKQVTLK